MLTPTPRMTTTAFQQWCRALQLTPATSEFLATKRASEPVRGVTSRATNVSGTYPSSNTFQINIRATAMAYFRHARSESSQGVTLWDSRYAR
jgi:hypothetical protein